MRYTTIIDVTEVEEVWRNDNACRAYLFLALRCSYQDQDRDEITISTRQLAYKVGITHAASRHALHILEKHGLLVPLGNSKWRVTKFVVTENPTSRPKTKREKLEREIAREREEAEQRREHEAEERRRLEEENDGKSGFMVHYENKMKAAEAGDSDAASYCSKNRSTYDAHYAAWESRKSKKTN